MRRTYAAALAAVLVLGVVGCGTDEPRPRIAELTAEPSTVTPTASASTPEQAVEEWIDAYNVLNGSGNPSEVDALGASNCKTCRNLTQPIADFYATGGRIESGSWSLVSVKRHRNFEESKKLYATVDFARGRTIDRTGKADPYDSERNDLEFTLVLLDNGSWIVRAILFYEVR